jgi:hypothetical protein
MKGALSIMALPAFGLALPSMLKSGESDVEKRQLLSPLLNDVSGLLGSIASSINPDNLRPEPGYEFQEPGPNDSRGPCPGM